MIKIKTKSDATAFLNKYIPKGREFKFPGEVGLKREVYLLKQLGDPQNKLKVIHLAGTSGKGSTAYLTSVILNSLGFKVGLSLSPTLLDIRERFQINNKFITENEYCDYLNGIVPVVEQMANTKYGLPTHFEIMVALTYYIFLKKKVDYAVIETGLGGLLDGTNVVTSQNKIAVITQIGLDHTAILGKTLAKIAFQKAGIIHHKNTVVTFNQQPSVMKVIRDESVMKKASLNIISKQSIKNVSLTPIPTFTFNYQGIEILDIKLNMLGSFQIQNCSLALATGLLLSHRDKFIFNADRIKIELKQAIFEGRMEKFLINKQTLIVDGAHNPQKMNALVKNLQTYFPNQKFVFMVSLRRGKNYKSILKHIIPQAKKIIIAPFASQTKVQGFSALAEDSKRLAKIFKTLAFTDYTISKNSKEALTQLFKYKKDIGVITGSLYLVSEVYPLIAQIKDK